MTPSPEDLLGRLPRDLRLSVTDRCNFRCTYCMPAEVYGASYQFLPRAEILTFEEITRLAGLFVGLGVAKIRLTGGEPLLREGLPSLVTMLSDLPGLRDLTLTTNGFHLAAQAAALKAAGLKRVTVSLDTLDPDTFLRINGRSHAPDLVLAGIAAAERAGLAPLKINCVVVRGINEGGILALASRFRGTGHVLRFIEFMDVGNVNGWRMDQVVPAAEILATIAREFPLDPIDPGYRGEVARRYRYRDGAGEIGMIASVTAPFCGDCTRARLSTDGKLYTCLFAVQGTDLREPMRAGASDEDLVEILSSTWRRRDDRYSEERTSRTPKPGRTDQPDRPDRKVEMYQIGG